MFVTVKCKFDTQTVIRKNVVDVGPDEIHALRNKAETELLRVFRGEIFLCHVRYSLSPRESSATLVLNVSLKNGANPSDDVFATIENTFKNKIASAPVSFLDY